MKKYLIRRIGWVFDDDWFNYDGEHSIEGVYNTESEVRERHEYLSHIYFLSQSFMSRPFQLNYDHTTNGDKFVDRDLLAQLVAKCINVDIDEIYSPRKGFIWRNEEQYLSKLSRVQVMDILTKLRLSFFNIIEIDTQSYYLYTFKRNPQIWSSILEYEYYTNPNDYYNFYDDSDSDRLRIVNSKLECYYYATRQGHEPITWRLCEKELIIGSLDKLSDTPNLLSQLIQNCMNLDYNNERQIIVFSKEVTAKELMMLDAVLSEPILIVEKLSLDTIVLESESNTFIHKEINRKYNLHERKS